MTDEHLETLYDISKNFVDYQRSTLPLCAAENVISPFANIPLTMGFHERYIMNNTYSYNLEDNFIGSEYLIPFYEQLSNLCYEIFGSKYSDARTFSGMNCLDMVLKTICDTNEKIMILGKDFGGHASVKPVAERLGLQVIYAPYNLEIMDFDYDELNRVVMEDKIKYILIAPSDLIKIPDVERINTSSCILLYDCSQIMGIIAAGLCPNPLKTMNNIVMFGGTHKTIPGPTSGLIMTNNEELHNRMEKSINPKYLRNTQMHQKISLLYTLVEFQKYGKEYMERIIYCSNYLGKKLEEYGYNIKTISDNKYSETHQVFIRTSADIMNRIYNNAVKYRVTLNKKEKKLFDQYGIRIGTQEIARYEWDDGVLDLISKILYRLSILDEEIDDEIIKKLIEELPEKNIRFAFSNEIVEKFKNIS